VIAGARDLRGQPDQGAARIGSAPPTARRSSTAGRTDARHVDATGTRDVRAPELVALTRDVPYVHLVAAREAEARWMRGFTTVRRSAAPSFALKRAIDEEWWPVPYLRRAPCLADLRARRFPPAYGVAACSANDISHAEAAGISASPRRAVRCWRVREQLCSAPARSRS